MNIDRKVVEQDIRDQCFEPRSIFDLLRDRQFNEEKYSKFYKTIEIYYETIRETSDIDRETAGYLKTFEDLLFAALEYHHELGDESSIRDKLQKAYDESSELLDKIYFTS